MPFEKYTLTEYNELTPSTHYRFAEIEMSYAVRTLSTFLRTTPNAPTVAMRMIYKAITPTHYTVSSEYEDQFCSLVMSQLFMRPNRKELISYFILKGHSYKIIREMTSASPNTIQKMKPDIPMFYPIFDHWTPDMLDAWNSVKPTLNIFNQPLYHV